MSETTTRETRGFETEVSQLLHLMVHSLYGNKEIFLRELVSNASDAADKLRFEAMTDAALFEDDPDPRIRVSYDKTARTITVSDNGIGMSRQEVVEHIGTIAKSGTREFLAKLTSDVSKDAQLIGQFGVGFYSSFIVAERVTLTTRRAGLAAEHGVRWESRGEGEYTIETVERTTHGSDVVLHLRAEEDEWLSGAKLREILRKYSDHIAVPILMKKEQWDPAARAHVVTDEDEQVNRASALWTRPKSEITEEQYHGATSTWPTTSSRRWRSRTRRSKGGRSSPSCCSSRAARRSICGIETTAAASSSISVACSSWTTRSS